MTDTMPVGLLWFDDSALPFAEKVALAAVRYYRKFAVLPDVCYVNSADLGTATVSQIGLIRVETGTSILPNHFWIGKTVCEKERDDI